MISKYTFINVHLYWESASKENLIISDETEDS